MNFRGLKRFKAGLLGLAVLAASVVSTGGTAEASFAFNPGGVGPTVQVNSFIESAGNSLSKNSTAALAGGPGSTFQLYFQAAITQLQLPGGQTQNLSGTYTAVGSITEVVLPGTTPTNALFGLAAVQQPQSGLALYFTPANNATNPAAGTGFINGTPILTATPSPTFPSGSNFTQTAGTQTFNKSGSSDFAGVQTINGFGVYAIGFNSNAASVNTSFFPGGAPSVIQVNLTNGGTSPVYVSVPPSTSFTSPFPMPPGIGTTVTPVLGLLNGTGQDFEQQTSGFITPVPEPSSLCLTGLGLVGLLAFYRKRNARTT